MKFDREMEETTKKTSMEKLAQNPILHGIQTPGIYKSELACDLMPDRHLTKTGRGWIDAKWSMMQEHAPWDPIYTESQRGEDQFHGYPLPPLMESDDEMINWMPRSA